MNHAAALISLIVACSSSLALAQNTSPQNCIDEPSGRACRIGPAPSILTDSDYGTLYVAITPPASVNAQAVAANKKGWKRWLRRHFLPGTKSGSLVADIYVGTDKVAVVPVALFSVDEKGGLKLETQTNFSSPVQVTPYFRLDAVSNPVKVVLSFQSSSVQTSNILSTFNSAAGLATSLGAQGMLLSAATTPITQSLASIESSITAGFSRSTDSQLTMGATFETDSILEYSFGFDPRGTDRSGKFTVQLVRRSSLFGSNRATDKGVPVFPWGNRTDPAAASYVLGAKPTGETLEAYLRKTTLQQFDDLRRADIGAAEFNLACDQVAKAVETARLSPHDTVAAIWASYLSGANVTRPELRETTCMRRWAQSFSVYGLALPAVEVPTRHPVNDPPLTPAGAIGTPANLSETGLRTFMNAFFEALALRNGGETRIRALTSMLAPNPHPRIEAQRDFGLASLDATANSRFVAEKLAQLGYRPGCYFRDSERRVHHLARVLDPATGDGPLWVFSMNLTADSSAPGSNSARIHNLLVRDASPEDLALFGERLRRPGCSDPATAPS